MSVSSSVAAVRSGSQWCRSAIPPNGSHAFNYSFHANFFFYISCRNSFRLLPLNLFFLTASIVYCLSGPADRRLASASYRSELSQTIADFAYIIKLGSHQKPVIARRDARLY